MSCSGQLKIHIIILQFPTKFEGKSGDLFVHSAAGQFFDNATYCIVKSLSNNCHCNDQSLKVLRKTWNEEKKFLDSEKLGTPFAHRKQTIHWIRSGMIFLVTKITDGFRDSFYNPSLSMYM